MRRITALVLALCMALTLTACGGKKADGFTADLAAFYEGLVNDEFPMMMEMTDDLLGGFYPGLTEIERKQTVVYGAAMSAVACEIAMVEVADAGDVDAVKDIFQARIDSQVAGGAWYPETIEQWTKAEIVVRGNIVCLFVAPEGAKALVEAFNGL